MATNPEYLRVSLLVEHKLSIRQIEDLFFSLPQLPELKNHLQQQLSYPIDDYDFFWLDGNLPLQKDEHECIGKYYDWPDLMQKGYLRLDMDMPTCFGSFTQHWCHLHFDWCWPFVIQDEQLQTELTQVGRELCRHLHSPTFLLLPCEDGNDYVYNTYPATKVIWYLTRFQSIEEVTAWLAQKDVPSFDTGNPQINSFLLRSV